MAGELWKEPTTSETGHAVSLAGLKVCKDLSWRETLGIKAPAVLTKSASLTWLLARVQQCTEFEASEKAKAAAQAAAAVAKAAVKPAEGAQQDGAAGGRGGK